MKNMQRLVLVMALLLTCNEMVLAKKGMQEHLKKAMELKMQGKLATAIEKYAQLLKKYPEEAIIHYQIASSYALIHQHRKALNYFKKALSLDPDHYVLVKDAHIGEFFEITKTPLWTELEEVFIGSLPHLINVALAKKLWKMIMKDQAYYIELFIAQNRLGYDSPVVQAIWDIKKILNEENVSALEKLLFKYGWPKISEVGKLGSLSAFCVIQHSEQHLREKCLPLLQEAYMLGEATGHDYARMYDRVQVYKNGKQTYGTSFFVDAVTGQHTMHPIEDAENVHKRRKELGLEPLEAVFAKLGMKNVKLDN